MFKKIVIFLSLFVFIITAPVYAIHLTCNPQENNITKYELLLNGETISAPFQVLSDGKVRLWYNIDHLSVGSYIVKAKAGDDFEAWSSWSEQFDFTIGVSTPQSICISMDIPVKPERLSQADWKVYHVSSEETKNNHFAWMAFDGDTKTQWHSNWTSTNPATNHPHELQINLGKTYNLSGFYYLPRQDVSWNGTIKSYLFYISNNGTDWKEIKSGSFIKTKKEQFISFPVISAKYISLVSLSEANGGPWAVVAELNLLGSL